MQRVPLQSLPRLSESALALTTVPNHKPIQKELHRHCYFVCWLVKCGQNKKLLANILRANNVEGEPTERDQRVAATLVAWLGTNCGVGFLQGAAKLCTGASARLFPFAYMLHWQDLNKETGSRNNYNYHVLRSLVNEVPFSELEKYGYPTSPARGYRHHFSPITRRDIDVSIAVFYWLGTPAGQSFIASVDNRVKAILAHRERSDHIYRLGIYVS